MTLRIVFMGSPDFALPPLRNLASHYQVVGVVTQPDRPSGRGRILAPPAVKKAALEMGLPFIQPEKLKEPTAWEQIQAWQPDLIVVAAFGQILRQNVLDLPHWGCLNVHASLLPRWRGASPIQAALLQGDSKTGVTIMKMDAGLDTGPVLTQEELPISPQDNAGTLSASLAELGSALLLDTIPDYLSGAIRPAAQDASLATYARLIKKEEGWLDFHLPAASLVRRVRAFTPWPGAFFEFDGTPVKVLDAHAIPWQKMVPGQRGVHQKTPVISTGDGWLALDLLQPAGKKPMPGREFLNGARNWAGSQAG